MFTNVEYTLKIKVYFKDVKKYKIFDKTYPVDIENFSGTKKNIMINSIESILKTDIGVNDNVKISSVTLTTDYVCDTNSIICEYNDTVIKVFVVDNYSFVDNIALKVLQSSGTISLKIDNFNSKLKYIASINGVDNLTVTTPIYNLSNKYGKNINIVLSISSSTTLLKTIKTSFTVNDTNTSSLPIAVIDNTDISSEVCNRDNNLFLNGVGMKSVEDLKVGMTDTVSTNTFDTVISLYGAKDKSVLVHPKVHFEYNTIAEYDIQCDNVLGKFNYSVEAYQFGSVKTKITKYVTFPYYSKYIVSASICFFKSNEWRTETLTSEKSYTFNASSLVNYDYTNKRLLVNNKVNDVYYDEESPYDIIIKVANSKGYTNCPYYIYDYSVSNVSCYNHNNVKVCENESSYIHPYLNKTGDNHPIQNSKIMYKITPFNIYYEEKFVTKQVSNLNVNILKDFDFDFELYEQNTGAICKADVTPIIEIISKDSFVYAGIGANSISVRNSNSFNCSNTVTLNNSIPSYEIDPTSLLGLSKFVTTNENNLFYISTTIKCLDNTIKVNGKSVNTGQSVKLDSICQRDSFNISIVGAITKIVEHTILTEPKSGYYNACVNGNAGTYQNEKSGKEDYTSKERPFLIPTDAYNIVYKVVITNIVPKNAVVLQTLIKSTDTKQYSMCVVFSSNYTESINSTFSELITSKVFKDNLIKDASKKQFRFGLDKPSVIYKAYYAAVSCTNPNLLLSYDKNIVFQTSTFQMLINVVSTKHPAAKWNTTVNSGYYYVDGIEYYMYSDCIKNIPVVNKMATINCIPKGNSPISVINKEKNLTMIVSNCPDNISVTDTVKPVINDLYLTYNNTEDILITCNDQNVTGYSLHGNFIRLENAQSALYTIKYKVKDSFSYCTRNGVTDIYINSLACDAVDVSFDTEDIINTDISLNPIHSTFSSGYIYIDGSDPHVVKVNKYLNSYGDKYTAYFELLDSNNNPVNTPIAFVSIPNNVVILYRDATSDINGVATVRFTATNITKNEQITLTAQNKTFVINLFKGGN